MSWCSWGGRSTLWTFRSPPERRTGSSRNGTWLQILPVRIGSWLDLTGRFGLFGYPKFLVLFLAGLWAWRSGLVVRLGDRKFLRRVFWIALAATILAVAAGPLLGSLLPAPQEAPMDWRTASFWEPWRVLVRALFDMIGWASAAAIGALFLLAATSRRAGAAFAPLAAVGRMTLTTYLTQSVVCTLLFYGYGLGWYGRVGYSGMLMITCALFAAQIAASQWWLHRFRFGPAEWLWRSLAYTRWQPMRLTSPESAGALSAPGPLPQ